MKIHAFITILVVGLHLTNVNAQNGQLWNATFEREIDSLRKVQRVPTAAIGFIENNKIVTTKVFGKYTATTDPSSNILFSVASLTKPVSMMLALTLASNKRWNLDEPLAHYWIDPDVRGDTLAYKLTSRHVLSHQGGFNNWRSMNPGGKLRFDAAPGTGFRYSGEGFEYLRRAIESKFHGSFDRLADSLLFKPLHMNHSYLVWPDQLDTSQYAGRFDQNGTPYPLEKSHSANEAASMITTIRDYTVFGLACLNGVGLSKNFDHEINTPQTMIAQAKDVGIGLSWVIVQHLKNREYALMHSGSDPGIKTLIVLLPTTKRGSLFLRMGTMVKRYMNLC